MRTRYVVRLLRRARPRVVSWLGCRLTLSLTVSVALIAGCGNTPTKAQSEVRGLFAKVATDGRAHRFAAICQGEITGVIRQLEYLVGGNCEKDFAQEWNEGVQLTNITSNTSIDVHGNEAIVHDGSSPDRARRVYGRWLVSEVPRNRRLAESNEVQVVLAQINSSVIRHHEPKINADTGELEPPQRIAVTDVALNEACVRAQRQLVSIVNHISPEPGTFNAQIEAAAAESEPFFDEALASLRRLHAGAALGRAISAVEQHRRAVSRLRADLQQHPATSSAAEINAFRQLLDAEVTC